MNLKSDVVVNSGSFIECEVELVPRSFLLRRFELTGFARGQEGWWCWKRKGMGGCVERWFIYLGGGRGGGGTHPPPRWMHAPHGGTSLRAAAGWATQQRRSTRSRMHRHPEIQNPRWGQLAIKCHRNSQALLQMREAPSTLRRPDEHHNRTRYRNNEPLR